MRYQTKLVISLSALKRNISKLQSLTPQNEILFMIKADAYGQGLMPIVKYAVEECGVKNFGCASLGEANYLRDKLSELDFSLYVFSDLNLYADNLIEMYAEKRIIPVISNIEDLEFILSKKIMRYVPLSLKINTGMNRLGIDESDWSKTIDLLKKHDRKKIFHLMSHLAISYKDLKEGDASYQQYELFKKFKAKLQKNHIEVENTSIANSGAIEQKFGLNETFIRPGLMLYGPSSLISEKSKWDGELISELQTNVIAHSDIKKGTQIGYGLSPVPYDGHLVMLPIGYGDGLPMSLTGTRIYQHGYEGKVVGKVSMDMMAILFPRKAKEKFSQEKSFTFWDNKQNNIRRLAKESHQIPYVLLTQISKRLPRVYII